MQWQRWRWMQGLGGTVVDDPPHTHARAGMMWQGQKEVNHPSMGLGGMPE